MGIAFFFFFQFFHVEERGKRKRGETIDGAGKDGARDSSTEEWRLLEFSRTEHVGRSLSKIAIGLEVLDRGDVRDASDLVISILRDL